MTGETEKDPQDTAGLETVAAKGRKRLAKKPTKALAPKKGKVTYYLSAQAIERVGIAATMEHLDKSEVVERLIQTHLRQWVVSYRGQRADESEEENSGTDGRSLAG